MRTLKITMMVAMALALGAANAQASSVDVIWQVSGTGTTVVTSAASVTGNIVITITGTEATGSGSGIELSADSVGVLITGSSQTTANTGWFALGSPTIGNPHSENVVAQGDLVGGTGLLTGSTIVGTITVSAGGGGTVIVSTSGLGDAILAGGGTPIQGEFTFGGGIVIVPEPTTASLLGLGLLGLSVAGRNRKN